MHAVDNAFILFDRSSRAEHITNINRQTDKDLKLKTKRIKLRIKLKSTVKSIT